MAFMTHLSLAKAVFWELFSQEKVDLEGRMGMFSVQRLQISSLLLYFGNCSLK